MKTDNTSFEGTVRSVAFWLFSALAVMALVSICTGRYQHVLTVAGCIAMAYVVAKHW